MRGGVFVCHASQDAGVAHRIVASLEAGGVSCWIAPRDIDAGQNYAMAILEGLSEAPAVVLLFSAATNESPHVTRELETAASAGTPIVPVRLEDVEPTGSLRYFIGAAHWLDAVGTASDVWEPPLVRAVRRAVGGSGNAETTGSSGVGHPIAPGPPGPLPPTTGGDPAESSSRGHRRLRWVALALGGALVLGLGLVSFLLLTGDDEDAAPSPEVAALPAGTLLWADESEGWRLRAAEPEGSAVTIVDDASEQEAWPQVLPGEKRILYLSDSNAEPADGLGLSLRQVNVDGSEDTAFLDGEAFCPNPARPAVNRDGVVAVTCFDELGERKAGIVLLSRTGERLRVLDTEAAVGGVTWMPDGKSLVYWQETSEVVNEEPGQNLYLMDSETEDTVRLTEAPARDGLPAVSPDGDTVVFTRILDGQQAADLYLLALDPTEQGETGGAVLLGASSPTVPDTDPTWVTNDRLVFCREGDLLVVDADPEAEPTPALDGLDVGEARNVTVVR